MIQSEKRGLYIVNFINVAYEWKGGELFDIIMNFEFFYPAPNACSHPKYLNGNDFDHLHNFE